MGVDANTEGSVASEFRNSQDGGINNDVELVSDDDYCTVPRFNSDGGSTGFIHSPNVSPVTKVLTTEEGAIMDAWSEVSFGAFIMPNADLTGQARFIDRSREFNGEVPVLELSATANGGISLFIYCSQPTTTIRSVSVANQWQPDQWTHVMGTLDSESVKLWVNGVLVGENTAGQAPLNNDSNQAVGIGNQIGRARPFRGKMRDVRFYNKALSAQVIKLIADDPYHLYNVQ
jgi:hypothetical protein